METFPSNRTSTEQALNDRAWKTGEAYRRLFFPSRAEDERFADWFMKWRRRLATPSTITRWNLAAQGNDLTPLLEFVRAPTMIIRRAHCNWAAPADKLREIAGRMADARYEEVPGIDHMGYAGDVDPILDLISDFVVGARMKPLSDDRVFAAVLFTDIVESTPQTAELGDRRWREILDVHDDVVRGQLADFRGRLVKATGDGVLATFDGPARAVRCARALQDEMRRRVGLDVRAGVHAGEVEARGEDVTGIAVNIARRVCDSANLGEVLVSRTVVDLVAGSGLEFEDHGDHELKGVPGRWQLYAVRA